VCHLPIAYMHLVHHQLHACDLKKIVFHSNICGLYSIYKLQINRHIFNQVQARPDSRFKILVVISNASQDRSSLAGAPAPSAPATTNRSSMEATWSTRRRRQRGDRQEATPATPHISPAATWTRTRIRQHRGSIFPLHVHFLSPSSQKCVDMCTFLNSDPYINVEYFPLYINWTNNFFQGYVMERLSMTYRFQEEGPSGQYIAVDTNVESATPRCLLKKTLKYLLPKKTLLHNIVLPYSLWSELSVSDFIQILH
jgi:hypothetical protein